MKFIYVAKNQEIINITRTRKSPEKEELLQLASLHPCLDSKKHARAVLQSNGFAGKAVNIEALLGAHRELQKLRAQASHRRLERRLGRPIPLPVPYKGESSAVLLPEGTPAQRLQLVREQAVMAAAKRCVRHGAPGGTHFFITLTAQPQDVKYEILLGTDWNTYGGRFKGWAANVDQHFISVPCDWRVRVQRQGLAYAGGMMTLDAHLLGESGKLAVYGATWVSQLRGYKVEVRRGFIARLGPDFFHAETIEAAIDGVQRKALNAVKKILIRDSSHGLSSEELELRRHLDECDISIDDARQSGVCVEKFKAWCNAVGVDLSFGLVSLRRVLEGYLMRPNGEIFPVFEYAANRFWKLREV